MKLKKNVNVMLISKGNNIEIIMKLKKIIKKIEEKLVKK